METNARLPCSGYNALRQICRELPVASCERILLFNYT